MALVLALTLALVLALNLTLTPHGLTQGPRRLWTFSEQS